jgi:hypothetical protein
MQITVPGNQPTIGPDAGDGIPMNCRAGIWNCWAISPAVSPRGVMNTTRRSGSILDVTHAGHGGNRLNGGPFDD